MSLFTSPTHPKTLIKHPKKPKRPKTFIKHPKKPKCPKTFIKHPKKPKRPKTKHPKKLKQHKHPQKHKQDKLFRSRAPNGSGRVGSTALPDPKRRVGSGNGSERVRWVLNLTNQ